MKKKEFLNSAGGFAQRAVRRIISAVTVISLLFAIMLVGGCDSRQTIIVYNWGEYIAEDTIAEFEKAFPKYKVKYSTFESNETMYPNLTNTYDVIIPSDYMVCRLMRENKLQKLDMNLLPNVTKHMDPLFNGIQYDQDAAASAVVLDYAVPYMYCTVGLVYDANKVSLPEGTTDPKEIWGVLFDAQYKNQVGMYDSVRESFGVALNFFGYSLNTLDEAELSEAQGMLLDQKKDLAPSYGIDNLKDKIAAGELVASTAWSGDHLVILDRIEELGNTTIDLKYALPAGSNWAVDMMCIPANAKNVTGAHAFINYLYEPEVALANCDYVGYSTPNATAKAMLPDEIKNNTSYYPDAATFQTLELFYSNPQIEEKYTELWNTVKASS